MTDPTTDVAGSESDAVDDDDVIVLPWWQRPANLVIIIVTTALLAGMIGWLIADAGGDVATSDADVGFLQDMRLHHEQAIDMSFVYLTRPDTDPRLRTVARSIIFDQGVEIGAMLQLLADMEAPSVSDDGSAMAWMGHAMDPAEMPGMASEDELDRLETATGAEADALFTELMTAHHEGGIEMATEAAGRVENDDVQRFAVSSAENQQSEIVELEGISADPAAD